MERIVWTIKQPKAPHFMGLNAELVRNFMDEWDSIKVIEWIVNEKMQHFYFWDISSSKERVVEWIEKWWWLPINRVSEWNFDNIWTFVQQLKNDHALHRILFGFEKKVSKTEFKKLEKFWDNKLLSRFNDSWKSRLSSWLPVILWAYLFLWIELKSWRKKETHSIKTAEVEQTLHYLIDRYLKTWWNK